MAQQNEEHLEVISENKSKRYEKLKKEKELKELKEKELKEKNSPTLTELKCSHHNHILDEQLKKIRIGLMA